MDFCTCTAPCRHLCEPEALLQKCSLVFAASLPWCCSSSPYFAGFFVVYDSSNRTCKPAISQDVGIHMRE